MNLIKSKSGEAEVLMVIAMSILGMCLFLLGQYSGEQNMRKEIINHNYGYYSVNATNGTTAFTWK